MMYKVYHHVDTIFLLFSSTLLFFVEILNLIGEYYNLCNDNVITLIN